MPAALRTVVIISKIVVADDLFASGCQGSLVHRTAAVELATGRSDAAAGMHSASASTRGRTSAEEGARNCGGRRSVGTTAYLYPFLKLPTATCCYMHLLDYCFEVASYS